MIEPFGVLKQIFKIDKMFLIFLIFQFFTFVELKKFVNVTFWNFYWSALLFDSFISFDASCPTC